MAVDLLTLSLRLCAKARKRVDDTVLYPGSFPTDRPPPAWPTI